MVFDNEINSEDVREYIRKREIENVSIYSSRTC